MYRFIETMRVSGGRIENIAYHNRRMNMTRQHFWPGSPALDLSDTFSLTTEQNGCKARVVYGAGGIIEKSVTPYTMRTVNTLLAVDGGDIDYSYKSTDRTAINYLLEQRGSCDDIIIVKNGLLTDTSFTNIALFDGTQWLTPRRPLLEGTRRAALLDRGLLILADIRLTDVPNFRKLCIFNAMIPFGTIEIDISEGIIIKNNNKSLPDT